MTPSKIERAEGGHTPRPWTVVEHEVWDTRHDGEPGVPLFRRDTNYRRWGRDFKTGEQDANARLVAAAPELLEACEAILKATDPNTVHAVGAGAARDLALAAIAKARGEA